MSSSLTLLCSNRAVRISSFDKDPVWDLSSFMKIKRRSSTSCDLAWWATSVMTAFSNREYPPKVLMRTINSFSLFALRAGFVPLMMESELQVCMLRALDVLPVCQGCSQAWSSASRADKRFSALLWSILYTNSRAVCVTLAAMSGASRMLQFIILRKSSTVGSSLASSAHGCSSVKEMYAMMPMDQQSHFVPYLIRLSMTSGATKYLVPSWSFSEDCCPSAQTAERPKSITLPTRLCPGCLSMRQFSYFRSRWTMLRS
mmetsp:Transcript_81873/g.210926  ORF Transcript_81873/g.210926 Transcript_81873/m.210926 type:complete len:258 (+) Transcript_81873:362-1135(+)